MSFFSRLFRSAPPPSPPSPPAAPAPPPVVQVRPAPVITQPAEEVVAAALSTNDPAALSKLVIDGASSRIRQLAAEAVHDPEQLRELIREVRGKDKNVYKILKQKTDALLAQERHAAQIQVDIESACAALERHSHRHYDSMFVPTLEHLEEQWNALAEHASGEAWRRAKVAIDRSRELVAQQLQKIASEAARALAVANADTQRQAIIDELRKALAALYASEADANLPEATAQQLSRFAERWAQVEQFKAANAEDKTTYERLRSATTQLSRLLNEHGGVEQQVTIFREAGPEAELSSAIQTLKKTLAPAALLGEAAPAHLAEASAALQAWEKLRNDKLAAEALALRQVANLIRRTGDALRAGQSRQALGLRRAVEERLQDSPAMPAHITKQLQQLDEKLRELQDWKSYAVAPKRTELIAEMEALIGSTDEPTVLAARIKDLQEQWKSISRGNTDDTEAQWQRFHQAAQTAYQPCREYFEVQAKQRQDNLDKRKALLDRLTAFESSHNWEQPDWRLVTTALRESRQEWRRYSHVERAAGKPLQDAFDALIAKLQTRLDTEYGKNLTEKKSLVARAQRLIASEDGRQAIDEIKKLQTLWKESGPVAREDDQKLWEEFRQHCDAVYQKRQQQNAEYSAGLETNKAGAVALCEQVEQIAALTGAELLEQSKKLHELRTAFEAVGELPRANARELHNRFERALDRCEAAVQRQRIKDKEQGWSNLLEAGKLIQAYRLSAASNADAAAQEAAKQAAQTFITDTTQWPKGGLQVAQTELAKPATNDIDRAANEKALRTLCIRAEILTDTATPDEDQALRRDYQMQRLMKSMGQGTAAEGSAPLDSMVFEWLAVGAVDPEVYPRLLERFLQCRNT